MNRSSLELILVNHVVNMPVEIVVMTETNGVKDNTTDDKFGEEKFKFHIF